ncbi:TPA: hypothetical protein ACHTOV_004653 [Enterobacter cancerogenus]|uniref:hypothetical protein n=1 Tax=Enterobacter cancerogenus TaxID=69218 RepID=UPI0037696B6B
MGKIICVGFVLLLSGCAQYKWVKEGANDRQEQIAETECEANSLRELPPDNVISGKYTSVDKKKKSTDTSYTSIDMNKDQREILVKDCMFKKGWEQIEIKN